MSYIKRYKSKLLLLPENTYFTNNIEIRKKRKLKIDQGEIEVYEISSKLNIEHNNVEKLIDTSKINLLKTTNKM